MFWVYLVIYLLLIAVGIFVLIMSCKGYKKENSLVGEVVTTTVITTGEPGLMYNEYGGNAEVEIEVQPEFEVELQVAPEIVIEVEEPIIEFEAPVEIEIQVDVDANVEVEIEAPIEVDIQGDVEIEVNL